MFPQFVGDGYVDVDRMSDVVNGGISTLRRRRRSHSAKRQCSRPRKRPRKIDYVDESESFSTSAILRDADNFGNFDGSSMSVLGKDERAIGTNNIKLFLL